MKYYFLEGSGEEFEFVEGNVIIQTSEYMEVLQREPTLITDQTCFNESLSYFLFREIR